MSFFWTRPRPDAIQELRFDTHGCAYVHDVLRQKLCRIQACLSNLRHSDSL